MLYVEVSVNLPIYEVFDYSVPDDLKSKVDLGKRVWVPFRNQKKLGYIVGLKNHSFINRVKPIDEVIDEVPLLDKKFLKLSKVICDYYVCSLAQIIELFLPVALRKGKKIQIISQSPLKKTVAQSPHITLIQDLKDSARWKVYLEKINSAFIKDKQVIFLVPCIQKIEKVAQIINKEFNIEPLVFHSGQCQSDNLSVWQKIRNDQAKIAITTRMGIFLPFSNLGLIIIDEENDASYKEEQSPYYHARTIALIRAKEEKIELVMADVSPSLESIYLAKRKKIDYLFFDEGGFPQVSLINTKNQPQVIQGFSYPLQETLRQAQENKQRVLIFLNRKGFSTFIYCPKCKTSLKCPRCNINLVYHFKEKKLICHYCNYQTSLVKICQTCQSSYMRYRGLGIEKIESKLSWYYPGAKILCVDELPTLKKADFYLSTDLIFKKDLNVNIDIIVVVSLDNLLNRVDFRATEKAFYTLTKFLALSPKRIIIQTELPSHYCFEAFFKKDARLFYEKELGLRKELKFPPFSHLAFIKIRGKNKEKAKEKAGHLFEHLKKINKYKDIKVISFFAHTPEKIRDNYIWQIMLKSNSVKRLNLFLKKELKKISFSSIIVSVDID